jgi:hypothetical protein
MSDFISDDEMAKLDQSPKEDSDFISDEQMQSLEPQASQTSLLDDIKSAASTGAGASVGGAVGAGIGAGVQSLAAKGILKGAEELGPYSPSQLSRIVSDYDQFQSLDPQQTMGKVEGQFKDINRYANDLERDAYSNLTEPLSREEYRKAVVKSSLPYTKPVPMDTPEFSDTTVENLPKRKYVDPALAQKEAQLQQYATLKAKEKVNNLKNASLGTMSEEQLLQEFNTAKADVLANPEGFAFVPDQKAIDLKNAADAARQSQDLKFAEKEALAKLQTPLAKEFPELTGKMYSSSAPVSENEVARLLQEYKYGDKLTGKEPYELVKNIRELAFDKNSGVKNQAAKAVQRELRDLVGQKNPEASQKLEEMSSKIQELRDLEKAGYLKRDKTVSKSSGDFVQVGEKQAQNLTKDLAPTKLNLTDDAVQRLAQLKQSLPTSLYQELELSVLKQAALDPRKQLKIGVIDTVMAGLNPVAAAIGIGTKAAKTPKGAIAAAKLADTLGSFSGKLGKVLPGALGAAGAAIGATTAAQAGEISPEEAAVLAPLETINPTPLDLIGAYSQGKNEYQKSGSIPSTAVEAAKASVAPMVDLATMAPQIAEQLGTQKSLSARERMEQNLNAFKQAKKPFKPMAPSYKPEEVQASLEAFKASSDPAAKSYIAPLEKALNAPDERTRGAIMFGLEQQPAFRELQRKK